MAPARIKFTSIASFKARVLSNAEDVACGLRLEIHPLLSLAFSDSACSLNKESFFGWTRWVSTRRRRRCHSFTSSFGDTTGYNLKESFLKQDWWVSSELTLDTTNAPTGDSKTFGDVHTDQLHVRINFSINIQNSEIMATCLLFRLRSSWMRQPKATTVGAGDNEDNN